MTRIFVDTVLGWYRRTLRELGVPNGQSGAVTVLQGTSADLRLNPHIHALLVDGVFVESDDGAPVFHALPKLDTAQVADLLQIVRVRVLRHLSRTGVVEDADELCVLGDDLAEREPALAALARAAVSGLLPAGPERKSRPPLGLAGRPGVEIAAPLSVIELGFSLHAATTVTERKLSQTLPVPEAGCREPMHGCPEAVSAPRFVRAASTCGLRRSDCTPPMDFHLCAITSADSRLRQHVAWTTAGLRRCSHPFATTASSRPVRSRARGDRRPLCWTAPPPHSRSEDGGAREPPRTGEQAKPPCTICTTGLGPKVASYFTFWARSPNTARSD